MYLSNDLMQFRMYFNAVYKVHAVPCTLIKNNNPGIETIAK